MSRARLPAALLALALVGGCDDGADDTPVTEGRGVGGARGGAAAPAAAPAGEPAVDPMRPPPDDRRLKLADYDPAAVAAERSAEPNPTRDPDREPARDLSAELRTVLGDPSSCLRGLEDLPEEVTITVDATVVATGIVTRAHASGAGVPEAGLDCVRERLSSARLRPPIDPAPRSVRTTLALRRRPQP